MIAVTGVALNQSKAFLTKNSVLYLWSTVYPANATNAKVVWSSSNTDIAVVDDHGVVYSGSDVGSCVITIKTQDGEFTASCELVIRDEVITVTKLEISVPDNTFYHYDYVQLDAIVSPKDATDKKVMWISSNTDVGIVDQSGKVYGNYYGTVTITAITEDSQCSTQTVVATDENGAVLVDEFGNELSDTIKVALSTSVTLTFLPVPIRGISFTDIVYSVPVASSVQTELVYDPSNADNKNVSYFSSDTDITSLNTYGIATGVAGGTAQIYAISEDGNFQASCTIRVLGKYVPNISNFKLISTEKVNAGIRYTFTFDHDALFFGGYDLEYSYDQSLYELARFYVDTNLQSVSKRGDTEHFIDVTDGICKISYTLPVSLIVDGSNIYFKMRRLSINRSDRSSFTSLITAYTFPSLPNLYTDSLYVVASNENDKIKIKFNNLNRSGSNKDLKKIVIHKIPLIEGKILSLDSDLNIESADIKCGETIVVQDYVKHSIWCDEAKYDNILNIEDCLLQEYSNIYTSLNKPYIYNLKLFRLSEINFILSEILDVTQQSYEIVDYQIDASKPYLYRVLFVMEDSVISTKIECPIFMHKLSDSTVYWRSLEASETAILKNTIWKSIRDCLIESHYYNKSSLDLPYSKSTAYSIPGYVGIANIYIDVYINDVYAKTLMTDDYGNFNLSYYFPIGETRLRAVARTSDNSDVSAMSSELVINTNYIHSWFAALAYQYSQIAKENIRFKNLMSIDTADEIMIKNVYGKMAGLSIGDSESAADFKYFIKGTIDVLSYIGKEEAVYKLINLYKNKIDDIDDIIYLPCASHESTKVINMSSIIASSAAAALPRAKYSYVVTSCTYDKQETDGSQIIVDFRYSPQLKNYNNVISLQWDGVQKATLYKVYRAAFDSNNKLSEHYLLTPEGITDTSFVDTGLLTPNTSYTSPGYNVSELINVPNLKCLNYYYINSRENLLKKPNYFTILLLMKGDANLDSYLLDRFFIILRKVSLAEHYFRLMVINDTSVSSYDINGNLISSITGLSVLKV